MSYYIELVDPVTEEPLHVEEKHHMKGGTYSIGGTTVCSINITYNYAPFLYKALGDGGIRSLYGKTGAETIPLLKDGIAQLGNDVDDDYWKPTEGNTKAALSQVLALAQMRPDGVWDGD